VIGEERDRSGFGDNDQRPRQVLHAPRPDLRCRGAPTTAMLFERLRLNPGGPWPANG
jgi:hypothetical protein